MEGLSQSVIDNNLYCEYFEAIALEDAVDLAYASVEFRSRSYPFADVIADEAYRMMDIIEGGSNILPVFSEPAFLRAARSYAYSGLRFCPQRVLFTSKILGVDEEKLYAVIKPDSSNIKEVIKASANTIPKSKLRNLGGKALELLKYAPGWVELDSPPF